MNINTLAVLADSAAADNPSPVNAILGLIVLGTTIWVFIDTKKIGVQKGQIKGILNMGRTGWTLATFFLWIIAFPCYLAKRGEYKRVNGK